MTRFARLNEDVLETFARGSSPEQLSATDPTRLFWEWKTNERPDDKKLPSAASRTNRQPKTIIIRPFGMNDRAKVRISQRSGEWAIGINGLVPTLNWLATAERATVISGFEPAKLIVRTGGSATAVERKSRITKRDYKTRFTSSDQGYTVPFGRPPGSGGSSATFTDLSTAIKALSPIAALRSVSFRNEIIASTPEFFNYTGEADADNPDNE